MPLSVYLLAIVTTSRRHNAISMTSELRHYKIEESKKEIVLTANNVALAKIQAQKHFLYNIGKEESDKTQVTLYTFGSERAIDFILSLGANITVIGPEDIRNSVRDKIMDMFQEYWEVY